MANNYVLALGTTGRSIVLGLEHRTKAECNQLIAWMNIAGFGMTFEIATYDGELDVFVTEAGAHHQPEQGPYTSKAWTEFRQWIALVSAVQRRRA
jgi:hypothetical protein